MESWIKIIILNFKPNPKTCKALRKLLLLMYLWYLPELMPFLLSIVTTFHLSLLLSQTQFAHQLDAHNTTTPTLTENLSGLETTLFQTLGKTTISQLLRNT